LEMSKEIMMSMRAESGRAENLIQGEITRLLCRREET